MQFLLQAFYFFLQGCVVVSIGLTAYRFLLQFLLQAFYFFLQGCVVVSIGLTACRFLLQFLLQALYFFLQGFVVVKMFFDIVADIGLSARFGFGKAVNIQKKVAVIRSLKEKFRILHGSVLLCGVFCAGHVAAGFRLRRSFRGRFSESVRPRRACVQVAGPVSLFF